MAHYAHNHQVPSEKKLRKEKSKNNGPPVLSNKIQHKYASIVNSNKKRIFLPSILK